MQVETFVITKQGSLFHASLVGREGLVEVGALAQRSAPLAARPADIEEMDSPTQFPEVDADSSGGESSTAVPSQEGADSASHDAEAEEERIIHAALLKSGVAHKAIDGQLTMTLPAPPAPLERRFCVLASVLKVCLFG